MVQHLYARSFMLMILGSLLSFGWVMAQEEPPDEPDDVEAVVPVFDLTDSDASEPAEPQEAVPVIPIPVLPTPHPTMTPIPPSELSSELFLDAVLASSTGADVTVDNVTDLIHEVNRATPFTKIIRLEPGTYVLPSGLTVNQRRLIIAGKGRGNPLTSTPDPATMAIIERDPAGSSLQLFRVMARGDLTLFNLVLRHGGGSQMGSGGALVIQSTAASRGKARLVQTRVTNSLVWGNGGGIYNEGGDLSVENSLFVHNEAGRGGAIANYQGSVRVTCTSFENNRVGDVGGAVHNGVNSSNFTITKSNFSNNVTQIWWEPPKGGAAYNHDSNAVGALQARGNWWGAPSGPPRSGRVNSVYRVDYANFRTTAVDIGRCPIPTDIFPLIAHAGEDQTVIDADNNGYELVVLNGSGGGASIAQYEWDIPTIGVFRGERLSQLSILLPIGQHTIRLTVTDVDGRSDEDQVEITVSAPTVVCTELENYYAGQTTQQRFRQLLFDPISESQRNQREACLLTYKDAIFVALTHELSGSVYLNMNEIQQLEGQVFNRRVGLGPINAGDSQPFVTTSSDVRYLYARTAINGMVNNAAFKNEDPMVYFGTNYNTAFSTASGLWPTHSFCPGNTFDPDGRDKPEPGERDFKPICLNPKWYSQQITNPSNAVKELSDATYRLFEGAIERAIHDHVWDVNDPTSGAYNAKPTNRVWSSRIDNAAAFVTKIPGPIEGHTPFIFKTVVTRHVALVWEYVAAVQRFDATNNPYNPQCRDAREHYCRAYPWGIWNTDSTKGDLGIISIIPTGELALPNYCDLDDETIPQAYMRHLREIYSSSVYNSLLAGQAVSNLGRNQVKYGMSDGPSAYVHALRVDWSEGGGINELTWDTFRFETNGGNPIATHVSGGEFIARDSNGNVITARSCPS